MEKNSISLHPNWGENNEKYYIPKGATKLVVGTMPPRRLCINKRESGDLDFFYGSRDNYFWKIVSYIDINDNKPVTEKNKIENVKITSEKMCKDILKKYNIGIIDIVLSCIHNINDKGDSLASDDDLLDLKPIDLIEVLKNNKNINTIFCTSNFAKNLLGIYYAEHIKYNKKNKCGEIVFKEINKIYKLHILYSPTRRVFNMFKNKRKDYIENYIKLLNNN